jgi:hypothetical protein
MLTLGVLSIVQFAFLPGFILLTLLRITDGYLRTFCLSVALSLTLNHYLVVFLTLLGTYTSRTLHCLFAVEIVLLLLLIWRRSGNPATSKTESDLDRLQLLIRGLHEHPESTRVLGTLIVFGAFACLLFFLFIGWNAIGTIFSEWDAVVSWNRWALDWSANRFPVQTWDYPQLLPTNVSLTYVFIGDSTIWLFAKAAIGFFPLVILLMQLDLGLRNRHIGYILSILLSAALIYILLPSVMISGNADMPVALLAFGSIYALLTAEFSASDRHRYIWIFLGTICCAGSALTKQAGIPLAVVYPILVYMLIRPSMSRRRALTLAGAIAIALLVLISPWYIYKVFQARAGQEILMVTEAAHIGRNYWQRVMFGYRLLCQNFGTVMFLPGFILLVLSSFYCRVWRRFLLLLILPQVAVWFVFNSYDLRNLALAIPLLATAAATGCVDLFVPVLEKHLSWINPLFRRPDYVVLAILGSVILLAGNLMSGKRLHEYQDAEQVLIGDQRMNSDLYAYLRDHPMDSPILTNWQYMRFLPQFNTHYVFNHFESLPLLQQQIAQYNAGYLFAPETDRLNIPEVRGFIKTGLSDGSFELVLRTQGYNLIQIKRKP